MIHDFLCTQCLKLMSWRYGKNTRCPLSVTCCGNTEKKSLFVLFKATAESMNCSLFLKNLEKHFCNSTYKKKNFVKHFENLPPHQSEKFIGDNLLITDIALRYWDLSIIGISFRAFLKLSVIVVAYEYASRRSSNLFVRHIKKNTKYSNRKNTIKL